MKGLWTSSLAALGLVGCLKGPAFFKQGGGALNSATSAAAKIVVPVSEKDGVTTGTVVASLQTQELTAGDASAVAGSVATFPPGAVAIATEITLQAGENLATGAVAAQLGIAAIASSGQPVAINSSVVMDTAVPFTLGIAVPPVSSLALADDPYANLAILYHVKKAGSGGADFTGLLPRDGLTVEGGLVRFQTSFFGTYQAVLTEAPVRAAAEVAQTPDIQTYGGGRLFYVRGPLTSTFGGQAGVSGQSLGGLSGWVHKRAPGKVGGPTSLEADYASKLK